MGHPHNTPVERRNGPDDASDSESDVPVDTRRLPEIAAVRPGAFDSRRLPLPRNTRGLLSASNNTNLTDYAYAVHIPPLNLPSATSPLRAFQAGEHLRRASFDAGYIRSRLSENSTCSLQIQEGSSTSAAPPLHQPMQLRESPAFASPTPRRHSDQIPSFRLRAAKWINAPSPSPSPDTAPSTPGHSDNPPATPSPGLTPASRRSHDHSRSEVLETTDPHPNSLVHRRVKSSERVSPYPTATVPLTVPGSTSEPAPEVKKKRKRTVKQRIRWIEVSPGELPPPTPSASTSAATVTVGVGQGISPPNQYHKPPPRRAPATTPAPKPWKEAQLKLDLRLEPPPLVPVTYYWPRQFEQGPSLPLLPVECLVQNVVVGTPRREVRVPPVSSLGNVAGPSRLDTRPNGNSQQRDNRKGKEKQLYESHGRQTDDGMDVESRSAGRVCHYPSEERRTVGAGQDIRMLVDDQRTQAMGSPISPARHPRIKWVYAQAATNNDSMERNWGHDTNAMLYTQVHKAGDVTWAYTRSDDQARGSGSGLNPADVYSGSTRSLNGSPTGRGGDGRGCTSHTDVNPPEGVLVKQEVDVDQRVPSSLLSGQSSLVKRETGENIHPRTHPTSSSHQPYHSTHPQPMGHLACHATDYPHQQHCSTPPPFPHFNPPTPHQITSPRPNPSSQGSAASITVPTADRGDPSPISVDVDNIPSPGSPQASSETQTQNTILEDQAEDRPSLSIGVDLQEEQGKADKGVKGIGQPDSESSPRESPMIETPGEPLAVQEMMHCMVDIERESEELCQKLSGLPDRRSPKPQCSVTGSGAASAEVPSSDFAEYELEEGEIMEN